MLSGETDIALIFDLISVSRELDRIRSGRGRAYAETLYSAEAKLWMVINREDPTVAQIGWKAWMEAHSDAKR